MNDTSTISLEGVVLCAMPGACVRAWGPADVHCVTSLIVLSCASGMAAAN